MGTEINTNDSLENGAACGQSVADCSLLPCPFCGGKAERCDCEEDCCNRIVCKNCSMEMVSDLDDFKHNVNVWNTRHDLARCWRSIESAPKDGAEILVTKWNNSFKIWDTGVVKWVDGTWKVTPTRGFRLSLLGTHWMPLPDAPK